MTSLPQTAVTSPVAAPKKGLALIAVFTTFFASSYFFRGSSITLPAIAADLDGMSLFSWAMSAPALASAFVTLLFGKLSDMYGRRIMLIISLALYLAGAVMASLSQTFIFFIAARVVICLGHGALMPLCLSVVGDLYPPVERSRWSGWLQAPAAFAALAVPTLVGVLTDYYSWRYFLWVAVGLVLVSWGLVLIGIPSLAKKTEHKIDYVGACLLAVASSTMILAFSWAGSLYSWTSTPIAGLLLVSLCTWAVFLFFESRTEEPLLDPQVLTNRTFLIAAVAALVSYFSLLAISMYLPLFIQGVQNQTATVSGTISTPFSAIMSIMGIPTGILLARTKRYKRMYIAGYGILTFASFCLITFNADTPLWLETIIISLAGLGLGAIPTMNTLVAQFALPKRLLGVAVGAMFFFVFLGNALGPAILGSAMNGEYDGRLEELLPQELHKIADQNTMESLTDSKILLNPVSMKRLETKFSGYGEQGPELFKKTVKAIRGALEASLKMVFWFAAVTSLLAFLLILLIPEVSMDKEAADKKARA